MSLLCQECGYDLKPGNELPGREGGMVNPNMIASVWTPDGQRWEPAVVPVMNNYAVCFVCISKATSSEQQSSLGKIYAAHNAEAEFGRLDKSLKGSFIQFDSQVDKDHRRLQGNFHACLKAIDYQSCLCCGKTISFRNNPYFTLKLMDRAHSEGNLSGYSSYQWSDIKTGEIEVSICFECCQEGFSKTFKQFSHDFRRTKADAGEDLKGPQILLSQELLEIIRKAAHSNHL